MYVEIVNGLLENSNNKPIKKTASGRRSGDCSGQGRPQMQEYSHGKKKKKRKKTHASRIK